MTVVPVHGALLDSVLDATYPVCRGDLGRRAYGMFGAARSRTAWGLDHQHRFALVDGNDLLASAEQYDLAGTLDGTAMRICGVGSVVTARAHAGPGHARLLVETLVDRAAQAGAGMVLLFPQPGLDEDARAGFETIPLTEVTLHVAQSPRHGAPMTTVRGGEPRDLPAIAAMGCVRAAAFRFHLDRSSDFIQHAITTKRLLAGLGPVGARELHFFIAEEGITAAAYVVVTITGATWTLEECGDRDPSGARVGALLQALIARQPAALPPTLRAWLPPRFLPPQLTVASAEPAAGAVLLRMLGDRAAGRRLSAGDVLYWRDDLF